MYGSYSHVEDYCGAVSRVKLARVCYLCGYEKAFDSINKVVLWQLLRHYDIPEK